MGVSGVEGQRSERAGQGVGAFVLGMILAFMGGEGVATAESISSRLKGFAPLEEQPVSAQLIAEHTSIQPGGQTRIGVLFQMKDGWHIYAQEPGDAGLATTVAWSVPEDVSLGTLSWPDPEAFVDPGQIQTFGYEEAVVLSSTAALAKATEPRGAISIQAQVEWLACQEICIPGSATLTLELPVDAASPAASSHAERFQRFGDPST